MQIASRVRGILLVGFYVITAGHLLVGCSTPEGTAALVVGGTALAAHSPGQQLEQIYYLGVFDPYEQLPTAIYRVRVRGQASAISGMKFGSGWVHASIADSLNADITYDATKRPGEGLTLGEPKANDQGPISPDRRLMLFGPEGFREAPKDHRLVIVMGSSPEKYFQAMNSTFALLNPRTRVAGQVKQDLFDEQQATQKQLEGLDTLEKQLEVNSKAADDKSPQ